MPKQIDFELTVESVPFGGRALSHIDGKAVFIPAALPGDCLKVRITREKPDYAEAKILKVIKPSKMRIPSDPAFILPDSGCLETEFAYSPGFAYYYTAYADEVRLKNDQFAALLERVPGFSNRKHLKKPFASLKEKHYRNKTQLHFQDDHGERRLGYFMADNTTVLDLPSCPLSSEAINAVLIEQRSKSGFLHTFPQNATLTLRETAHDGVRFWRNAPPKKAPLLTEQTSIGALFVPQGSFFQINPSVGEHLIQCVQEVVSGLKPKMVYDLFCGVGLFGLAAAPYAERVIGTDSDRDSILCANANAAARRFSHVAFSDLFADVFMRENPLDDPKNSLAILDPPRTGLTPGMFSALKRANFNTILYISCAPDTLVRDLTRLCAPDAPYELVQTHLADMFPRTPHFETVTLLRAKK